MPRHNLLLDARDVSVQKSYYLRHSGDNTELAEHIDACKMEKLQPLTQKSRASFARRRCGWSKLPTAQSCAAPIEQVAALKLKSRDCFVSHPLLSEREISEIAP